MTILRVLISILSLVLITGCGGDNEFSGQSKSSTDATLEEIVAEEEANLEETLLALEEAAKCVCEDESQDEDSTDDDEVEDETSMSTATDTSSDCSCDEEKTEAEDDLT